MLTARRDPPFHADAHDRSRPAHNIDLMAGHPASGHSRFMTALQMIGSVLAIPLGLASGYSIYHSNFSTEAQCQNLRTNIVSMLDKNADATTLRMLVRRDVATFETTCGSVDPEAVAAFKNLLASAHPTAPAHPAAPPQKVAHEPARPPHEASKPAPAKQVVHEHVRPQEAAKPAPAKAVEAKPIQGDMEMSDAKWVASVRDALIQAPEPRADAVELPADAPSPAPVQPAAPVHAPRETLARPLSSSPPAAEPHAAAAPVGEPHAVAPALPPAASIAEAPVPASPADHPVPPAAIPDSAPMPTAPVPTATAESEKPAPSGIRGAIAGIPLLGRLVK